MLGCLLFAAGCSNDSGNACELEDQDGIIGGTYTFAVRLSDVGFEPLILSAQNSADVVLTVSNVGTREGGFSVDCLATPNDDGCATSSCFPDAASSGTLAPNASKTIEFQLPQVEGIYTFRAVAGDDSRLGQFIVR